MRYLRGYIRGYIMVLYQGVYNKLYNGCICWFIEGLYRVYMGAYAWAYVGEGMHGVVCGFI